MYSRVKIAGHPVHPMIVAYPIAFYTATFVALLVFFIGGSNFWWQLSVVADIAGVVTAVLAALVGFVDWLAIPQGSAAKRTGQLHMRINAAALALFLINAVIQFGSWNSGDHRTGWGLVLSLLGVVCVVGAGFFGWTLVQRHHVGIELSAEQERLELAGH